MLVPLAVHGSASLLAEAEEIYRRSDCPRFDGSADWLRRMLARVRGDGIPVRNANWTWLFCVKYGLATAAAACVLACSWWLAPLALLVFYAVEVQWLFLFPVVLDGAVRPFAESRALMRRQVGTAAAITGVLPIAARMLTGGWAVGCIAILLWYERVRNPRP